ncbi:MAG: cache domain-containing protein [Proteocatella sp.]
MKNKSLKHKLISIYGTTFLLSMFILFILVYYTLDNIVKADIRDSLEIQNSLFKSVVDTSTNTAIKNYFRAISENDESIVENIYSEFESGKLTESEAKDKAWKILSAQKIGLSGYTYVVNSKGIILYHPKAELIGADLSGYEFIKKQMDLKSGFITYDWKNPDETEVRKKALAMAHFKPWDWIISVSGYRDEYLYLLNFEDIEEHISDIHFGKTGYLLVIDENGKFVIHPKLKNINLSKENSSMGNVLRTVLREKNGTLYYDWKNPGEENFRKKVIVFSEIKDLNMIIAATGYEEEFLEPIKILKNYFIFVGMVLLVSILIVTRIISGKITKPIADLKIRIDSAASGSLDFEGDKYSEDEVGAIGRHFEAFLNVIEAQKRDLLNSLNENIEIAKELNSLNEELENRVRTRTEDLNKSIEELKTTQQKLIEEERFSYTGKLVSKLAHYLNTPIGNSITTVTYLSYIIEDIKKEVNLNENKKCFGDNLDQLSEGVERIEKNLNIAGDLIDSFKLLKLRVFESDKACINLNEFLETVIANFRIQYDIKRNIDYTLECSKDIMIYSYTELLSQIFEQLLENSNIHAFLDIEKPKVRIEVYTLENMLKILYIDNGNGMKSDVGNGIFEALNRDDFNQENIGVGLNIVYNIVKHNLLGEIYCTSQVGNGVRFEILIPYDSCE